MKILLVSSSSGSQGGGEIYLHYLAAGLTQLGHRVIAMCSTAPRMNELAQRLLEFAEVRRTDFLHTYDRPTRCFGAVMDRRQQERCASLFQTISPDVVHINQQVAEDGLDLIIAAQMSGLPFVSTIHITHSANLLGARFGRIRDWITGNVLRQVNGTHISVAKSGKHDLLTRFPFLNPNQVMVVLNGVIFPRIICPHTRKDRWDTTGETVIGSIGRLEVQKAPSFALHIIANLVRRGLPIRYVWVGDGPLRHEFENEARQLGLGERTRVTGWRNDISAYLEGVDILLMPSNFEGLPLALLEAMGTGLCCCVANVDGMAEIVEHGKNGFLCPTADAYAWGQQIAFLACNKEILAKIGSAAKHFARARFSADRMAADTLKVYEDAIHAYGCLRQGQRE